MIYINLNIHQTPKLSFGWINRPLPLSEEHRTLRTWRHRNSSDMLDYEHYDEKEDEDEDCSKVGRNAKKNPENSTRKFSGKNC